MNKSIEIVSQQLGTILKARKLVLTIAESCTGGLLSAAITAISGASSYFERGYVTYSNSAKKDLLGVSAKTLEEHGAVSEETVKEMAIGALRNGKSDISIALTGIAGPTGEGPGKPIGTVYFAWKVLDMPLKWVRKNFNGTRDSIRQQAVVFALTELIRLLESKE
jgi:nicotinamide-nucleotide amidase